ncbi:hypothetical protein [Photobacterium leiognathi]|uniref:hypothetical protein n=1 Tax=Photobacterium leiognathi TaxID=553611 RepID=UPI0027340E63|nr:hypothetical protein [Photobacterium leiognathi]
MEQSEYNAMCLEQVDNDGVTFEVNCPVCGKKTQEHHFELAHSGCVNAHSSTNCSSCGYHVCDVDGCKRCEN